MGDGVQQSKEARRMPGVKKLLQESENPSKPAYIFGHMFDGLGILVGNQAKKFCLPLSIRLHGGLQFPTAWKESDNHTGTHIVQWRRTRMMPQKSLEIRLNHCGSLENYIFPCRWCFLR